jgi:hypothetical protein
LSPRGLLNPVANTVTFAVGGGPEIAMSGAAIAAKPIRTDSVAIAPRGNSSRRRVAKFGNLIMYPLLVVLAGGAYPS